MIIGKLCSFLIQSARLSCKGCIQMKKSVACLFLIAAILVSGTINAQEQQPEIPMMDLTKEFTVDKLLATVKTTTISAGDVQVEKKIMEKSGGSILSIIKQLPITDTNTFYEMLVREMIYQQALQLGFDQIEQEEILKEVDDFRAGFASDEAYLKFLQTIEYKDPKFNKQMEANLIWQYFKPISHRFKMILIVKQAIAKKIGLQIKLTLPGKFEEDKPDMKARHPEKSEEELKSILEKELFATRLSEWITDIASRTDYRILDKNFKSFLVWMEQFNDQPEK